jgi:hypothetical protein
VNHVVVGNAPLAAALVEQFGEFPIALTREVDVAREWLRDHCGRDRRAGLVASSGALRHRAYGIEVSSGFRQSYAYDQWFLGDLDDCRSCSALEVAASEFEIQGLELDWTGLCWGNDFWYDEHTDRWTFQRLAGAKMRPVEIGINQQYIRNKYRVLLTRAREGMIIWLPRGRDGDATLQASQFDSTARFLEAAGVPVLK